MHRGHDKVLIYTIFVLSLTRWTSSTPLEQSQYYEEQLAKEVIRYRKQINPVRGIANASPDAATGWITQEVLQSFEYNLRFVLKIVSDFYQFSLSSWETAKSNADVDHNIKVWRVVSEPSKQFETIVCSLVPRLLAFLYACTNDPAKLVQLHRLHSVFCLVIPSMVEKISPEHTNQSIYLCDAKTVTQLHEIKREFPPDQMTSTSTEVDQLLGTLFVENALKWADGVDKKRMLSTFLYSADSQRNVFWVTVVNLYRKRTDGKEVGELNEKLWKLSIQYVDNLATSTSELTLPDIFNRLVTSALKTLMMNFGRVIRKLFTRKDSFGRNTVNDMLFVAVNRLCEWTPLVLAYLVENCSDTADIAVPFGLYLTLCGDWDGFLEVQCPKFIYKNDEEECVLNAITDRLLMNFCRVTGSVSAYDDSDDSGDTNASKHNLRISHSASNYVLAVYMELKNHYDGLGYEFPEWTASDWLTGKHLLANRFHDPECPACALGEQTILLSGNGDRPATEVLLSEAHNFLLPWHSDSHNVFAFHAALFSHADQMMNEFIHRHAAIVSLFLRYHDGSLDIVRTLDLMLSYPFFQSFGWYVECARRFHYYLHMPGPREPRDTWSVDDLMSENENLERNHNMNIFGQNATTNPLSAEKIANLSAWTERQLSSFSSFQGLEYPFKFIQMLENNCMDAVKYVNNFILIAQYSKITRKNAEYLPVNFCKQFVHGELFTSDMISTDSNL